MSTPERPVPPREGPPDPFDVRRDRVLELFLSFRREIEERRKEPRSHLLENVSFEEWEKEDDAKFNEIAEEIHRIDSTSPRAEQDLSLAIDKVKALIEDYDMDGEDPPVHPFS